jgi:hypothetical protein
MYKQVLSCFSLQRVFSSDCCYTARDAILEEHKTGTLKIPFVLGWGWWWHSGQTFNLSCYKKQSNLLILLEQDKSSNKINTHILTKWSGNKKSASMAGVLLLIFQYFTYSSLILCSLTFWHQSFTFNSNKSPTWCNNFSVYYPDVRLQLNMFRAFSRPSSGAQWLQWQPLILPSYRGDSCKRTSG